MTVTFDLQPDRDLVIFAVRGLVSAAESVDAIDRAFGTHPARFAIWDFSEAGLSELDIQALNAVASSAARYAEARRGPVSILVVPTPGGSTLMGLYRELSNLRGNRGDFHLVESRAEADALCRELQAGDEGDRR